ncbi:hypothetical protein [Curtobacterium sp. MCBA15_001]|uniref:hypothetical protein n=1 Tax=Curtobacterium sp. MCBA15_001 TaxID=1898731 RepID=UPI000A6E371A|nr:hypothetical protein [Curtobacterium sp. MCBA15_001]
MSAIDDMNAWDTQVAASLPPQRVPSGDAVTDREVRAGSGAQSLIDADLVLTWLSRVHMSKVVPAIQRWRADDRAAAGSAPGGRKAHIDDTVILVIALILVIENSTVRVRDMGRVLESRLTPEAREVLGISHLYDGKYRDWYFLAFRAVHRLIDTFDGWDRKRWASMTHAERTKWEKNLDLDHVDVMRARGEWFTNALIEMTLMQQPRKWRRKRTALSVDQTTMRAGSQQSRWQRDKYTKQELPMANHYTGKEVDKPVLELEADLFPRKKSRKNRDAAAEGGTIKASDWEMVFMANIIIDVHEDPTGDHEGAPPQLVRAASLGTPNKRVGEHTIALVDSLLDRGYDITRLVFDRGYSGLTAEKFHQPLADRNIDVVKDYIGGKHNSQLGISNGVGGAPFADDRYFCAGTPKDLLETGKDFDEGSITEEQHWKNLRTREDYELHLHDRAKDGSKMRFSCPALGPSPTVDCPLRELHAKAKPSEEADRPRIYERDMPQLAEDNRVCCQNTITVKSSDNVKNRQKLRWHSKDWFRTYRVGRNAMESLNDTVKDDIELDKSSHRPMRGMAAQQFAFALLMVATNMKRIIQFEHELYILDKRAQEGRPPQPRKQKHERLQRRRDRLGRSNYKRNPDPVKLVPMPRT